jgi:hypothetical protein
MFLAFGWLARGFAGGEIVATSLEEKEDYLVSD